MDRWVDGIDLGNYWICVGRYDDYLWIGFVVLFLCVVWLWGLENEILFFSGYFYLLGKLWREWVWLKI